MRKYIFATFIFLLLWTSFTGKISAASCTVEETVATCNYARGQWSCGTVTQGVNCTVAFTPACGETAGGVTNNHPQGCSITGSPGYPDYDCAYTTGEQACSCSGYCSSPTPSPSTSPSASPTISPTPTPCVDTTCGNFGSCYLVGSDCVKSGITNCGNSCWDYCPGGCSGTPTPTPPGSTPTPTPTGPTPTPTNTPTPTFTPTPTPNNGWWQVGNADVTTNGDLISQVPNGLKFDVGGFVGVPTYGGSTNLNSTTVSDTHWLANSQYSLSNKKYDYSFFSHWIPEGTILNDVPSGSVYGDIFNSGTVSPDGYYWFKYSGPVDLHVTSLIVLGSRKAILLVEGHEVYFEGNIQVTDGSGFFMVIANKNIRIAPAVNHIQAVFVADLNFYTGTGSLPLLIKGSVVAYGQVYPGRDLGPALNATTPGTVFEYDPNLFYLYPRKLSVYKMRWKEVAP